jgi:hypothetical protein
MEVDPRNRLEQIGFRRVGRWNLTAGKLAYALDDCGLAGDVLYAFVSGQDVLYIGKTTQDLQRRMYGYQRPGPTQRTNIACNAKILEALSAQGAIDIYVFRDPEPRIHVGVPINLAAALEDGLIREFKPPWNKAGLSGFVTPDFEAPRPRRRRRTTR